MLVIPVIPTKSTSASKSMGSTLSSMIRTSTSGGVIEAMMARFSPGNAARALTCIQGESLPAMWNICGTRKML
jgi:hypothetical protein